MGKKRRKIAVIFAAAFGALCTAGFIHDAYSLRNSTFSFSADRQVSSAVSDNFSFSDLKKGKMVRVKDGDTYAMIIDDKETTVRLIGVDTPESVAPSEYSKENTSEGKTISEIVKKKLQPGDVLYVEYDAAQIDKYGRTLVYLYFEDGLMVQEWLLQNGYAQVMTVQPNSKYAERFAEIQHKAAADKIGLWADKI